MGSGEVSLTNPCLILEDSSFSIYVPFLVGFDAMPWRSSHQLIDLPFSFATKYLLNIVPMLFRSAVMSALF